MVDTHSPDRQSLASREPIPTQGDSAESVWLAIAHFPILGVGGASLGFVGCMVASLVLEAGLKPAGPTLSYGQQWGLIVLPLCTLIGAAIGLGVAFALVERPVISLVLLLVVSIVGSGVVSSMWNAQIARYGRDPSEVVLYYPPLALSMLALVTAVLIAATGLVRWRLHSTRLMQHPTADQR
jgi:hypothetical protein